MRRSFLCYSLISAIILLTGCASIGDRSASLSAVYGAIAVLALLLLLGYCCVAAKKDTWFLLLFSSVSVVNIGYFALSISGGLGEALLANRLSYLGSVFLPLSMLMIIINATHISYRKWLPGTLLGLAILMFLIAASPGYLTIYYEEVSFVVVDGVAALKKVYGPLHSLYLVYLLGYFATMIAVIVYTAAKGKLDSPAYAVIIAIAVFVNLGVWLVEQLVYIPFEILSISYIISESFLLGVHILMGEAKKRQAELVQSIPIPAQPEPVCERVTVQVPPAETNLAARELFLAGLAELTPKERQLYDCYVARMTTDVIMEQLAIKENTLKFHSKNLYSKLGVRSRKQLVELHETVSAEGTVGKV